MRTSPLPFVLALVLASCTPAAQAPTAPSSAGSSSVVSSAVSVGWVFTPTRTGKNSEPFGNVTVQLSGGVEKQIALGEFLGSCTTQTPQVTGKLGKDVVTSALCWFAGGGDEFLVRKTGNALQVEHRTVDEGSDDEPAVPQQFKAMGNPVVLPTGTTVK